jgi:hypothetical protein
VDVEKISGEPSVVTYKPGGKVLFPDPGFRKRKKIDRCHHSRCKKRSLDVKRRSKIHIALKEIHLRKY